MLNQRTTWPTHSQFHDVRVASRLMITGAVEFNALAGSVPPPARPPFMGVP
jgi:hypothetical protein